MQFNPNLLGLFGSSSSFDYSALQTQQSAPPTLPPTARDFAKMTPWDNRVKAPTLSELAKKALASTRLIDPSLGSGPGSSVKDADDKTLFILHNGIKNLQSLADAAAKDGVSATDRAALQKRIDKGMAELRAHMDKTELKDGILIAGKRLSTLESKGITRTTATYDTKLLAKGDADTVPLGFEGNKKFVIEVDDNGTPKTVNIDLSEMGTTARTVGNVSSFINTKLNAQGIESSFSRVETKIPGKTKTDQPTYEQRMRITVGSGEKLTFKAASGDADPAIYVVGGTKVETSSTTTTSKETGITTTKKTTEVESLISKIGDFTSTSGLASFENKMAADGTGTATARATVKGPDGSVYVIADATGAVGSAVPKGSQDVVLRKYDTTGQVVWTRSLGSAAKAEGFSLAIGANGTIAVAGTVDGKADTASTTTGNGKDSFVAAFDNEGRDLWYHQQGAIGTDKATNVAVADDGSVYLVGQTTEAIGGAGALGGTDVYLQAFDTSGTVKYTKSIGGSGDDSPAGLVLKNGAPVVVWNDAAGAKMASYDAANGTAGTVNTLSGTNISKVTSVVADETGRIYLAGSATATGVANQIAALDATTGAVSFTKQTAGEPVRALIAGGGTLAYATDVITTTPATANEAASTARVTHVLGLDANTGTAKFDRSVNQTSDAPISLAIDTGNSKSLDAMGLPQGDLRFGDAEKLMDKTGLRTGDHFFIEVNGKKEKKITIDANETMRTLAAKLTKALLQDGKAEVRTSTGKETLVITPAKGDRIELKSGPEIADALKQLGLEPGIAIPRPPIAKAGTKSVSDPPPIVALDIPTTSDVSDKVKAKALADSLDSVLRRIRIGYRDTSSDPTQVELRRLTAKGSNKNGATADQAAIARYNAQAAAGQDALRRMGVSV